MSSYSSSNDQYDHSQSESDHSGSDSSILSEDDNDIDNPEMLTLNLAFGNKTDTIQVHWNDDPEDLARVESFSF